MDKAQRLQTIRIFEGFGSDEIHHVAAVAVEKIYPKGTAIIQEGELGEGLFAIVEGEVEVNKRLSQSDEEITLVDLKPGDHFGEMGLIDGKPGSASIIAKQPTICFVIKRGEYFELLAREPIIAMKLYRFYAQTLCERLRQTDDFLLLEHERNKDAVSKGVIKGST